MTIPKLIKSIPGAVNITTGEPIRYRMSPLGTWMHARAFKIAADGLRGQQPGQMPGVVAFLYCRAIELGFKAYLLARGVPARVVRAWGHKIGGLLVEAHVWRIDEVVALTADEKDLVRRAGDAYEAHVLGYFDLMATLMGDIKHLGGLSEVADRLVGGLEHVCHVAGDEPAWAPPTIPPAKESKGEDAPG
jgi:hypothetical protein